MLAYELSFTPSDYDDSILESFYDDVIEEHQQILTEATKPVKKEGFGSRIVTVIKNILKLIVKALGRVIDLIKSIFRKNTKSADQILMELGVKGNYTGEVSIPEVDSQSKIHFGNVNIITKPLIASFNKDSVTITSANVIGNAITKGKSTPITGRKGNYYFPIKGVHNLVFKLMDDSNSDKNLKLVADELSTERKLSSKGKAALDSLVKYMKVTQKLSVKNFTVTSARLTEFQQTINYVHDKMQTYDLPESGVFDENLKDINVFAQLCNEIQFGLNTVAECMSNIYAIDAKYVDSIGTVDTLSKFSEKLIDAGIPAKYTALNILLVADQKIKGPKANPLKPILGQTRTVLFPPNKGYVLKIALSKMGARANEAEGKIYNKVKNTSASKLFAAVEGLTPNKCITMMEKITNPRKPSAIELKAFRSELSKVTKDMDIPLNINADMHFDNVRFRDDGHAVTIDYGMAKRINT